MGAYAFGKLSCSYDLSAGGTSMQFTSIHVHYPILKLCILFCTSLMHFNICCVTFDKMLFAVRELGRRHKNFISISAHETICFRCFRTLLYTRIMST